MSDNFPAKDFAPRILAYFFSDNKNKASPVESVWTHHVESGAVYFSDRKLKSCHMQASHAHSAHPHSAHSAHTHTQEGAPELFINVEEGSFLRAWSTLKLRTTTEMIESISNEYSIACYDT
jgi:hypothetical protein